MIEIAALLSTCSIQSAFVSILPRWRKCFCLRAALIYPALVITFSVFTRSEIKIERFEPDRDGFGSRDPEGSLWKKEKDFPYYHVQLLFFVTTQQQSRNLRFFDQSISFHSRFNHMRTNGTILWTFNSFSYYWSVLNRRNCRSSTPSTKVRQLSVCACGFSA